MIQLDNHRIIYSRFSLYPRLICVQAPKLNNAVTALIFQAGSRYSPFQKEGLAHLFEHLFISRTKAYPRKQDFFFNTEKKGFVYNAYTGKRLVNYYLLSVPGNEEDSLNYLLKSYKTSLINKESLKQEKLIVRREENRNRINPSLYIHRLVDQAIWPNIDFSRDVFGSEASINNINLDDIKKYQQNFYQPNNLTILILSPRLVNLKKIKDLTNQFNSQKGKTFAKTKLSAIKKEINEYRKIEDVLVNVSYRLPGLEYKDRVRLDFITNILAGGWNSILIRKLRLEQFLTYWVQKEYFSTLETGYLILKYNVSKNKLKETLRIIKDEVQKLHSKEILEKDLNIYKKINLTKFLTMISNPYRLLIYYSQFADSNEKKAYSLNEAVRLINQLDQEAILKLSKKCLNYKELSMVTIGNFSPGC